MTPAGVGTPYPDAGGDYSAVLFETGWSVVERLDVTAEFARCMDVLLHEYGDRHDALLKLVGEEDYADRLERRQSTRAAVAHGLLKREIFLVHRR